MSDKPDEWPTYVSELLSRCVFESGPTQPLRSVRGRPEGPARDRPEGPKVQGVQETDLLDRECSNRAVRKKLFCAVSGGADSMAMLVLAVAAGYDVTAIHVDHGLRSGSEQEASIVEEAASSLGADFRSERVHVGYGPNLEARARAARYGVLPNDVATGHTMDDQAETILMNLLRGSGIDGLSAMVLGPRHPILSLRRVETHSLCQAMGLRLVHDESNDDRRFVRNRVRHELLPLCMDISRRDIVPILARQSELMRDDTELLEQLTSEMITDPTDLGCLDVGELKNAPPPIARRAVRNWLRKNPKTGSKNLEDLGSARYLESGNSDSRDHVESYPPSFAEVSRILDIVSGLTPGTEITGGRSIRRRRGKLVIEPIRKTNDRSVDG